MLAKYGVVGYLLLQKWLLLFCVSFCWVVIMTFYEINQRERDKVSCSIISRFDYCTLAKSKNVLQPNMGSIFRSQIISWNSTKLKTLKIPNLLVVHCMIFHCCLKFAWKPLMNSILTFFCISETSLMRRGTEKTQSRKEGPALQTLHCSFKCITF